MAKIAVELGEVQETLLIPLYGRARDARSRRPVLGDSRAVELVDTIDYDFTGFGGPSLSGSVLRTSIIDGWVRDHLREHPDSTVVEIGAGLNTRFDRVDNGRVHWIDLDLPDTIDLRRRFFTDSARCRMIPGSVLETDWFEAVDTSHGPALFVIEAVLLYLSDEEVRTALTQLAERFPGSRVVFDTGGTAMIRSQERNGSMKAVTARMRWVCDDPGTLEPWGLRLEDSRTFARPQPEVARTWPRRYRHLLRLLSRVVPRVTESYRLNLFTLTGPDTRPPS
ncbi:class I SAM-dependent methyltransferase [Streptomyces sp. NPDC005438]|uniref:class I SAM-dependent methyltransferase n=1 Tax=Streptomyces sp. NPDC005438 TaxID=3156880 RepID=UPI0033A0BC38